MPNAAPPSPAKPPRRFGRFELRRLLGKSSRTMAWLVFDPEGAQEMVLVLPRTQPADALALARWMQGARRAARLDHPHLARVVEVAEHERWPYIAYDRAGRTTLAERGGRDVDAPVDIARWMREALDGLAFAHEAGLAHRDLQTHLLWLDDAGQLQVLGLEVAPGDSHAADAAADPHAQAMSMDTHGLRHQRDAAERDVLSLGIVMHHLLAGQPALDEPDVGRVIERLPPLGRDLVRLPWSIPRPVAEPLRAIVNRATDRQERQRYRSARTLARALQGWLEVESEQGGSPHELLLDRVRQIGALPALPGSQARADRFVTMERERTNELAVLVLKDLAVSFELLRLVNTAQVRGSQVTGNGPVLTIRRAIAMLGLEGVRRAVNGLRVWPGPLGAQAAHELDAALQRVRRTGRLAQSLRPAGYDAEVVYLVTLLQNLGRLLVQYHFPDEAVQIARLMQPEAGAPGQPDEPGMPEDAAAFAVLGSDIESMGAAVARYWGLDDAVLHMIRRLPVTAPVRHADTDDEVLRMLASAANEAMDATALPPRQVMAALDKVVHRYARTLHLTLRELQSAVQAALQSNGDPVGEDEHHLLLREAHLPEGARADAPAGAAARSAV